VAVINSFKKTLYFGEAVAALDLRFKYRQTQKACRSYLGQALK